MSNILNLMAIERAIKNHFDSDVNLKEEVQEVLLEPNDDKTIYPNISIFRQNVPFEIITTAKVMEAKPLISIFCSVISHNRDVIELYTKLDSLVEKTFRSIKNNNSWGLPSNIATSKPTAIEFHLGDDEEDMIAVARIDLELTIYYS